MDTQLVRLDGPYNIICGNNGHFALHIATLIVVKEKKQEVTVVEKVADTISVACYPIVADNLKIDGQVWMHTELNDCLVIGRQGEELTLYSLKKTMEYCAKHNIFKYFERIPSEFCWAMMDYNCKILLDTDDNKYIIKDYEVELKFEEDNGGNSCMAYSSSDSRFYFYEYFDNEPPFNEFVPTNMEAIDYFAKLRDNYLRILQYEGLRSITFTTTNEKYLWFVDRLNSTKTNE